MKKITLILIIFALAATVLCGCAPAEEQPELPSEISLYVPDGAPSLSVADILNDKSVGGVAVNATITTGDDAFAKCTSGEADIAILPTNAAVKVLSARDDYCLFTVNVQGLLYLVGTSEISSLSDLMGQTVYSIGLGNTPEYVFKKILDSQSIAYCELGDTVDENKVNLKYEKDGSSIIPLLASGKAEFAVLGEPAVTQATNKLKSQGKTLYELADLQQLWQQATGSSQAGYPQASLIVKKSLVQNKSFADALYQKLSQNADFVEQNAGSINQLMQDNGSSLDITYTAEILQRCNLVCIKAESVKSDIESYLGTFSALSSLLPLDDAIFFDFD